MKVMML